MKLYATISVLVTDTGEFNQYPVYQSKKIMKSKLVPVFVFVTLVSMSGYAQDGTATRTKETRQQERTERKARLKEDLKDAGQEVKRKAKIANEAIEKGAKKVGAAVNTGLDKAENAIVTEADKLKSKRDSSKTEKARRDSL